MDKIKNMVYEYSDVFLGFFILASMVCIMGWQLYSWFEPSSGYILASDSPASTKASLSENTNSGDNSNKEPAVQKNPDISTISQGEASSPEVDSSQSQAAETQIVAEIVIFQIKRGSACINIANDLESMGLISSSDEFVGKITSLGLENKLKSGSYSMKKGDSVDNIIKTLTD
ncbi:hypothetical protein SAMN02745945_01416 [Peptoclostridium litorale DSM 5388]|uniref:YceG-like family protein n=1 Tax=Peptoclostridium litorale DSM 5388 TaxID=1121324 RepID=A0A069RHC2_PEPLI|nr:endolytic transglycosylase MltG [Peptoclostridium litorale]KDR95565.1 hypothetical protein CLIT_10c02920 [Peptoclostridium litorale DSM 5388]SIN98400.1 hypothetical protein SAMN02745945_01416 [Peptoclostridium litorale DSM 5388]